MEEMQKILIYPHPLLRKKTKKVEKFGKYLRELSNKMKKILSFYQGAGLAANQIGEEVSFFIAKLEDKFYAIANPKITSHSKEKELMEEGCLSIPGKFGLVERFISIVVEGENIQGKKIKIRAKNLLAQIFQHEIDHLNGILFIDKAKEIYEIERKDGKVI